MWRSEGNLQNPVLSSHDQIPMTELSKHLYLWTHPVFLYNLFFIRQDVWSLGAHVVHNLMLISCYFPWSYFQII